MKLKRSSGAGVGLVLEAALGVAAGMMIDNVGLGIALGAAFGLIFGSVSTPRSKL
jgi:hypothetical protein